MYLIVNGPHSLPPESRTTSIASAKTKQAAQNASRNPFSLRLAIPTPIKQIIDPIGALILPSHRLE
jgi:hypothetical protein